MTLEEVERQEAGAADAARVMQHGHYVPYKTFRGWDQFGIAANKHIVNFDENWQLRASAGIEGSFWQAASSFAEDVGPIVNPAVMGFGLVGGSTSLARRFTSLLKLERQHRERLAAVWMNETALKLLRALDQETSIRWENLPDITESDWCEASRSAALLVGANLCEVSPTRIRLSEYGDKLLAGLTSADHTNIESEN